MLKDLFCSLFHRKHYRFWWTDSDYFHSCKKCGYNGKILLLLFSLSPLPLCVAQGQEIVNLTPIVRERGHLGFAAYWQTPTNGTWVAEWSTNAITWTRCSNETLFPDGLRYTETGSNWAGQYFVRLRKLP